MTMLGPCCICGGPDAEAIVMLDRRCIVPGHGWGCVVCGLPNDGASSVLCDGCREDFKRDPTLLKIACRGYPATEGRIAIADLPPHPFDHDTAKHEEFEKDAP